MRILDGVKLINGAEEAVWAQAQHRDAEIVRMKKQGAVMRPLPQRVRSGRLI